MSKVNRYTIITEKFPREMLLLVGSGCKWRKCTFCDYYNDSSDDPFSTNKPVIEKITGHFNVLDIINSGSCFELDEKTLDLIKEKANECNIKTIWFETHWLYHKRLDEFRNMFPNQTIKFRVGIETFDPILRNSLKKGIPNYINAKNFSKYFNGACLLVGIKGQSKESILSDIDTCSKHFEYFSVNVFNKNSTKTEINYELVDWFKKQIEPKLRLNPKIEVLINNTDLGIGYFH